MVDIPRLQGFELAARFRVRYPLNIRYDQVIKSSQPVILAEGDQCKQAPGNPYPTRHNRVRT